MIKEIHINLGTAAVQPAGAGTGRTVRIIVSQKCLVYCLLLVYVTVEEPINEVAVNEVSCARGQREVMFLFRSLYF